MLKVLSLLSIFALTSTPMLARADTDETFADLSASQDELFEEARSCGPPRGPVPAMQCPRGLRWAWVCKPLLGGGYYACVRAGDE